MTEDKLCELGENYYRSRGWEVLREVPFASRSIDMLLIGPKTGKIIGIEFKLRNWKKALMQAAVLQLGMSWVFIAMPIPKRGLKQDCIDWAGHYGIGIILYDGTKFSIALRPNSEKYRSPRNISGSFVKNYYINRLHWAIKYVRNREKDRFPNERWGDWALRHNIYAKSRT